MVKAKLFALQIYQHNLSLQIAMEALRIECFYLHLLFESEFSKYNRQVILTKLVGSLFQ